MSQVEMECYHGILVDEGNNFEVVSFPFVKFFDIYEIDLKYNEKRKFSEKISQPPSSSISSETSNAVSTNPFSLLGPEGSSILQHFEKNYKNSTVPTLASATPQTTTSTTSPSYSSCSTSSSSSSSSSPSSSCSPSSSSCSSCSACSIFIYEKLDGIFVCLYFYQEKWNLATQSKGKRKKKEEEKTNFCLRVFGEEDTFFVFIFLFLFFQCLLILLSSYVLERTTFRTNKKEKC